MKKIALILLVLALTLFLAAPAMADFKAYGSVRVETFYVTNSPAVGDDDQDTVWDLQHNSRFGAKMKTGDIAGRVELGLDPSGQETYGGNTYTRLLYGTVKMGGGTLLVGQDYDPYTLGSAQVSNTEAGFEGFGKLYDGRQPQIRYTMDSGLYVAAIKPKAASVLGAAVTTEDLDTTLPKLCVGYDTKFEKISLGGGIAYNSFNEEDVPSNFDESISSMLLYVHVKADLGGVGIQANFGYGTNLTNFGIASLPSGGAAVTVAGDVEDTTTMSGYVQATFKAGKTPINLGIGYATSDNDEYSDADAQMGYFINAKFPLADNFFIVPEFFMADYMDDETGAEENDVTWVGLKWHLDF